MELDTINKLYMELSQFATAKTAKDVAVERAISRLRIEAARLDKGNIREKARAYGIFYALGEFTVATTKAH